MKRHKCVIFLVGFLLASLSFSVPHSPLPDDKTNHIVVSFTLVNVLGHGLLPMGEAVLAVRFIGVMKEVYDATIGTSGFDFFDLVSDEVGVSLGRGL